MFLLIIISENLCNIFLSHVPRLIALWQCLRRSYDLTELWESDRKILAKAGQIDEKFGAVAGSIPVR